MKAIYRLHYFESWRDNSNWSQSGILRKVQNLEKALKFFSAHTQSSKSALLKLSKNSFSTHILHRTY